MPNAAAARLETDLVLDRYRPLKPLGTGGTGSVWLARDERNGLDVALKIVPREGKAAARAEREAEAAARLRHPHCQRAYGFGRDSGHVYIAYEYTPGRTFREVLRSGDLGDARAIEAAAQILEGLAHAHGRGIVHRDVKPSNVLLADDGEVSARLLDFGLAQIPEAETLTAVGDVPGTLAYIAPERLAGETATAAADVWAVGVMLWEALAGRHPFWQTSLLETARAIERGAEPLEDMRPDLPKAVLTAVGRALELDPARRPSAAELVDVLRSAARKKRRRRSTRGRSTVAVPSVVRRALPCVLAAVAAGWTAAAVPFFPRGWPFLLAALAAGLTFVRPRLGLVLTLAVPVLPLGNISLGLALVYAAVATFLLVLSWGEPESGFLFALGPLFAPLAALGLLPAAVQGTSSAVRRAAQVAAAVLFAGIVAGIRGASLPFDGSAAPRNLGLAASDDPFDVASALWAALVSRPALLVEALVLALAAAAIPYAREHGLWGAAGLGGALLAATLLPVAGVSAVPLVLAIWATCAGMAALTFR